MTHLAVYLEAPAHEVDELAADREAQAGAPGFLVVEESARVKCWKIWDRCASGLSTPVSRTAILTGAPPASAGHGWSVSVTRPCSVNLVTLSSR